MYGDTAVLRRRAAQLREQGGDIRALADQLVARSEAVAWTGRAASMMRERMRDRAALLRDTARSHESAADSLVVHLGEVDRLTEAIAGIEHKAASLVGDARARLAERESHGDPDGVRREPTPEDRVLLAFAPPPSGHRDWLDVSLPGL